MSDIISDVGSWPFWLRLPGPGCKPVRWNCFAQAKIRFESFESLIDVKLWESRCTPKHQPIAKKF